MITQQKSVNPILPLNAFFLFLFKGVKRYYHTIYLELTYFAYFTDYEDDMFEIISNLHVHGSKFGGKINRFGGKSFTNFNSTEFMEFVFQSLSPIYKWNTGQNWLL